MPEDHIRSNGHGSDSFSHMFCVSVIFQLNKSVWSDTEHYLLIQVLKCLLCIILIIPPPKPKKITQCAIPLKGFIRNLLWQELPRLKVKNTSNWQNIKLFKNYIPLGVHIQKNRSQNINMCCVSEVYTDSSFELASMGKHPEREDCTDFIHSAITLRTCVYSLIALTSTVFK